MKTTKDFPRFTLHHGDCLEMLKKIPSNSVHSIVTDPPYNISFSGSKWDSFGKNIQFSMWCREWASQCYRIVRPGGFLIAFSNRIGSLP